MQTAPCGGCRLPFLLFGIPVQSEKGTEQTAPESVSPHNNNFHYVHLPSLFYGSYYIICSGGHADTGISTKL